MKEFAVLVTLLWYATLGDSLLVGKCCSFEEYVTAVNRTCRTDPPAPEGAWNGSRPPYWLPAWLRAEPGLEVWEGVAYDLASLQVEALLQPPVVLEAGERLGRRLLAVDGDARRFVLEPFGYGVDPRAVAYQQVCFDVTDEPRRPFVVVTWLYRVLLPKCCADGASLDAHLRCRPAWRLADAVVDVDRPLDAALWLPAHLRDAVPAALIQYDRLRAMPGAEDAWVDADDPNGWRFLFARPRDAWVLAVWTRTGGGIAGASSEFCFDATEDGSGLPAHVLLARIARVKKCCRRGQQLNHGEMQCVARASTQVDARPTELLAPGDPSAYWLPPALASEGHPVPVRYFFDWDSNPFQDVFSAERARVVGFPERPAAACVRLRTVSGRAREACASNFCFEAATGGFATQVLAVKKFYASSFFRLPKCCQHGQMLYAEPSGFLTFSSNIRCRWDASEYWAPENSSLTDELHPERLYLATPLYACLGLTFTLVEEAPERELDLLLQVQFDTYSIRTFYCKDLLRESQDGPARDVLAFCELPASRLFTQVRPLQVVAAVLLLAAVGAVLAQRALRRTTHGRALACHAACLMAANALQAAWFFIGDRDSCDGYAFVIYFFLVAGAFWLNVISFNMARGFRRPDGARSREADGGGRRWRLVLLYAWGLPAVITAVSITAYQLVGLERRGYDSPTFSETRICYADSYLQKWDIHGNRVMIRLPTGALYYYYLPCGALVAANTVCLVLTVRRIRALRSDARRLQREHDVAHSALLYVKLLLTAGVLELGLEASVWAIQPHLRQGRWDFFNSLTIHYVFAVVTTFLDLARAVTVLWLAVGRWSRVRAAWRGLRARLRLSPRPPPPPPTARPESPHHQRPRPGPNAVCSVPRRNHVTRL